MIKSVAELIAGFMREESIKLAEFNIKHGPTIGEMYEGLSAKILEMSIPEQLELKITNGFIYNGIGGQTGQIDCMLVKGNGIQIPYTQSYKWHIKDVLVVFEVKKNLYSKELADSFKHLRDVSYTYSHYLFEEKKDVKQEFDFSPVYKIFSQMTGVYAPSFFNRTSLSKELQLIYVTLITELISPIKVVLGYQGFKTEYSLREGLISFLESEGMGAGLGIPAIPHLITCNGNSLVKVNGNPYFSPLENGRWHFLASTSENPLLILLELLWTKISREFDISMPWGEDLELERFNRFLSAKPVYQGTSRGWEYYYTEFHESDLSKAKSAINWQPTKLTENQFIVMYQLLAGQQVFIDSPSFIEYIQDLKLDLAEFVQALVETRLVALWENELKLIAEKYKFIIDSQGNFLVGEDDDSRFTQWFYRRLKK